MIDECPICGKERYMLGAPPFCEGHDNKNDSKTPGVYIDLSEGSKTYDPFSKTIEEFVDDMYKNKQCNFIIPGDSLAIQGYMANYSLDYSNRKTFSIEFALLNYENLKLFVPQVLIYVAKSFKNYVGNIIIEQMNINKHVQNTYVKLEGKIK